MARRILDHAVFANPASDYYRCGETTHNQQWSDVSPPLHIIILVKISVTNPVNEKIFI
jgi:hypothetical protein